MHNRADQQVSWRKPNLSGCGDSISNGISRIIFRRRENSPQSLGEKSVRYAYKAGILIAMDYGVIWIITNNCMVQGWANETDPKKYRVKYISGTIRDVALFARDEIMRGKALAADPVAGRRERPTPYLTVLLKRCTNEYLECKMGFDVLQLENFVGWHYLWNTKISRMREAERKDFQYMDYSLTINAIKTAGLTS